MSIDDLPFALHLSNQPLVSDEEWKAYKKAELEHEQELYDQYIESLGM